MLKSLRSALVTAFAIAALSTLGDFVWARWIPEHRPLFGLSHGLVLGAAIGLALGVARGRAWRRSAGQSRRRLAHAQQSVGRPNNQGCGFWRARQL